MRAHNIIMLSLAVLFALRFLTGCALPVESEDTGEAAEEMVSPRRCQCHTWEKQGWAVVAGVWMIACTDVNTDVVRVCH